MNKTWNKVPARYVAFLISYLEHEGLDCAPVLRQVGVERNSLAHAEALLPAQQVIDIIRLLALTAQRSDLGLSIGSLIGIGQLGEVGRAMLCCASLRDALDCCARYYELVTPSFSMTTRTVGSAVELSWLPIRPVPYDLMLLSYDIAMMAVHRQLTYLLRDDLPGYDIFLSTPAPAHVDRYRQLRPGRCHFSQGGLPALRIVIDADALNTAMPMANAADLADTEKRLQTRLSSAPQYRDWKAWVLLMLRESRDHQPTQSELAALLSVSTSTLSRHLAAQDCSYRDLSMAVRHERACTLLQEGRLSVGEIAKSLGYTHTSNFIRAFKGQTGLSPLQFV